MSDSALENAEAQKNQLLERKRRLQSDLAVVDAQLNRIERFIVDWHEFAGTNPPAADQPNDSLPAIRKRTRVQLGPSERTAGNSKKEEVADAARAVIADRGEPVSRSDLLTAIRERGLTIEGTDPEMVLSTMLWRMKDRVIRLKQGGYWLKEQSYEPAGYFPNDIFDDGSTVDQTPHEEIDID